MVTSLWNSHAAELFYAKACSLLLFWSYFGPFVVVLYQKCSISIFAKSGRYAAGCTGLYGIVPIRTRLQGGRDECVDWVTGTHQPKVYIVQYKNRPTSPSRGLHCCISILTSHFIVVSEWSSRPREVKNGELPGSDWILLKLNGSARRRAGGGFLRDP